MRIEYAGDRHPHGGNAHHDFGVGGGGQSKPAVLDADRCAEQTHVAHLRDDLGRPRVGVIVLLDDRLHLALQPSIDGVEQMRLVGLFEIPLVDDVHCAARPPGGRP